MSDRSEQIIALFAHSEEQWLSGEKIAEAIGVSRVSVWNILEGLQEEGYSFEAVRGKGYRLKSFPGHVEQIALKLRLDQLESTVPVFVYPEIDSTNSEVERQFSNGRTGPFAVLAQQQTAGRGRSRPCLAKCSTAKYLPKYGLESQSPPRENAVDHALDGIENCPMGES